MKFGKYEYPDKSRLSPAGYVRVMPNEPIAKGDVFLNETPGLTGYGSNEYINPEFHGCVVHHSYSGKCYMDLPSDFPCNRGWSLWRKSIKLNLTGNKYFAERLPLP